MTSEVYRYAFCDAVQFDEALETVDLAIIAVESLHGSERTRLDARFVSDPLRRSLVIDASTHVGQALNQIFTGYARREFGDAAFRIERINRAQRDVPIASAA